MSTQIPETITPAMPVEVDPRTLLTPTNGYIWAGERYRGLDLGWEDLPAPVGGDVVYAGFLGMRTVGIDRLARPEPEFVAVPNTAWGDYCGALYDRSNYEVLLEEYPDTFVVLQSGHDGHELLLPLTKPVDSFLLERLHALIDYPVADEQHMGRLEMQLADEAWDAYLRWDVKSQLEDAEVDPEILDQFDVDDTERGSLHDRFYTLVGEMPESVQAESATSVTFPYEKDVISRLAAEVMQVSPIVLQVRQGFQDAFSDLRLPPLRMAVRDAS